MNFTYGIELEFCDVRTVFLRKLLPARWECQGDNSIRNTDGSWSQHLNPNSLGSEVKTIGGLSLEDIRSDLPEVYKAVTSKGGDVNDTTGLHVHVGYNWKEQDILKLVSYFADNRSFGKLVGCSESRAKKQCCKITAKTVQSIARLYPDMTALKAASSRVEGQHTVLRQLEINVLSLLHHGTVEFRAFNQTMNLELVMNCVEYAGEVLRAALEDRPIPTPTKPLPEAL